MIECNVDEVIEVQVLAFGERWGRCTPMQVLAGDIASAFNLLLVFTYRSELRIRYPAILERASLSCGAGWAELLDALCAPTKERRRQDGVAGRLQMRRFSALIKRLDKAFGKFYVGEDAVDEINCY